MANQLINGTQMASEPSAADPNEGKIPTFGYHADGRAQVFHLNPGQALPAGWHDSPVTAALDAATIPEPKKEPEPDVDGS